MLALFSFVRSPPNELIVLLSARERNTVGRFPIMTEIYHVSHKMFSHQKKLDGNKGPHSLLAAEILSAELQHRCLEIIMHTGAHLNNSRIN